jgi:hypothetical protein
MARTTDAILEAAANTYRERHPIYGRNWHKVGGVLAAMFPEGITLKEPEDFTRFYLFVLQVMKQTRYANNFASGGHPDSALDTAVYSALLLAVDEEITDAKK